MGRGYQKKAQGTGDVEDFRTVIAQTGLSRSGVSQMLPSSSTGTDVRFAVCHQPLGSYLLADGQL